MASFGRRRCSGQRLNTDDSDWLDASTEVRARAWHRRVRAPGVFAPVPAATPSGANKYSSATGAAEESSCESCLMNSVSSSGSDSMADTKLKSRTFARWRVTDGRSHRDRDLEAPAMRQARPRFKFTLTPAFPVLLPEKTRIKVRQEVRLHRHTTSAAMESVRIPQHSLGLIVETLGDDMASVEVEGIGKVHPGTLSV